MRSTLTAMRMHPRIAPVVEAVAGKQATRLTLGIAGVVGAYNFTSTLAGWHQQPLTANEKLGTAIAHGALVGATALIVRRAAPRTIATGALVGTMSGNVASALLRGDHPQAPRPRPGNALTDITGEIGRDAKELAIRNGIAGGVAGLGIGVLGARLVTGSWLKGLRAAVLVGGAGAGVGAATGALDGAWRGLHQGTGIAIGRGLDALDGRAASPTASADASAGR